MAAYTPITPSGVNASGLSCLSLMHGAVPVPTPLLTAETVALLDAMPPRASAVDELLAEMNLRIERQELAARRSCLRVQTRVRHTRRSSAARVRIRS